MRAGTITRVLFILYCVEAGLVLAVAPWNPAWDRLVVQIPLGGVRDALFSPFTRAAITGFGLVHWVWGLHDLHLWLRERRERATR